MLDWVATMTDEQMAELSLPMTAPELENPIIDKEVDDKLYAAEIHYYQMQMYGESQVDMDEIFGKRDIKQQVRN